MFIPFPEKHRVWTPDVSEGQRQYDNYHGHWINFLQKTKTHYVQIFTLKFVTILTLVIFLWTVLRSAPHLKRCAVQLQKMLSIHILGGEKRDIMFQAQTHEPAGHLLTCPLRHTAVLPLILFERLTFIQNLTHTHTYTHTELWPSQCHAVINID